MENEAMQTFLSIGIVGTFLSVGIQYLQDKYGVAGRQTKLIAIVGSIALGTIVWFLQGTEAWVSILGILGMASTVYAFVFSGKNTDKRESV